MRRKSGVAGLDEVLRGGLLSGSAYIIRGMPGAGKTTLANQICFHQAALGERCLYVTLLAESHDRLLENLSGLQFFRRETAEAIYYESGFDTLERDGLKGIQRLLLTEARRHGASVIVLDGLFALQERVDSERDLRLFVNQLQSLAHLTGCTMLLLTNSERGEGSPEYTMVDGWLELGVEQHGYRVSRYLQVHKFRGSGFLEGRHALSLSEAGVRVFPRYESYAGVDLHPARSQDRLGTGIAGLDAMMGGGLRRGTNTLIVGATGLGKTAVGLHFLARSTREEPGLLFGFYETEGDLVEKAELLGIGDVRSAIDQDVLEVIWHPATEQQLDELARTLVDAVHRRGVKRLFVDGVDAFQQATVYPERIARFLAALANELRVAGVTAMFTLETPQLVGGEPALYFPAISPVSQNIVLLRYVEVAAQLRRTIAVIKTRTSAFDPRIREFEFGDQGVRVGDVFRGVEDVLSMHGHPRSSGEEPG